MTLSISDSEPPAIHKKVTGTKFPAVPKPVPVKERREEEGPGSEKSLRRLLSSSGLGEAVVNDNSVAVAEKGNRSLQTLVNGGCGGAGGGKVCGGGRRGSLDDGDECGPYDSNHGYGHDCTDAYYQKMIEANPGNPLLLSNYAKFLKEVCFVELQKWQIEY